MKKRGIILCVVAVPAIFYFLFSSYLKYANEPFKADAIVLFVGYNNDVRNGEAMRLLRQGYANYLLIPAWHEVLHKDGAKGLVKQYHVSGLELGRLERYWLSIGPLQAPENTHIEMIIAKAMMKKLGLKSAIFVSSPYHLRRIKMIAEAELGNEVKMAFVPAVPDSCSQKGCSSFKDDIRWLGTEMVKILWFWVYQHV